jgi:hypothetical protein
MITSLGILYVENSPIKGVVLHHPNPVGLFQNIPIRIRQCMKPLSPTVVMQEAIAATLNIG